MDAPHSPKGGQPVTMPAHLSSSLQTCIHFTRCLERAHSASNSSHRLSEMREERKQTYRSQKTQKFEQVGKKRQQQEAQKVRAASATCDKVSKARSRREELEEKWRSELSRQLSELEKRRSDSFQKKEKQKQSDIEKQIEKKNERRKAAKQSEREKQENAINTYESNMKAKHERSAKAVAEKEELRRAIANVREKLSSGAVGLDDAVRDLNKISSQVLSSPRSSNSPSCSPATSPGATGTLNLSVSSPSSPSKWTLFGAPTKSNLPPGYEMLAGGKPMPPQVVRLVTQLKTRDDVKFNTSHGEISAELSLPFTRRVEGMDEPTAVFQSTEDAIQKISIFADIAKLTAWPFRVKRQIMEIAEKGKGADEPVGNWISTLAQNQAELIKEELIKLGVSEEQVICEGVVKVASEESVSPEALKEQEISKFAKALMKEVDLDGGGRLTANELHYYHESGSHKKKEIDAFLSWLLADKRFGIFDEDGSGALDTTEIQDALRAFREEHDDAGDGQNADHDKKALLAFLQENDFVVISYNVTLLPQPRFKWGPEEHWIPPYALRTAGTGSRRLSSSSENSPTPLRASSVRSRQHSPR